MPPIPLSLQPPPFKTPFLTTNGAMSEEWKRFHLSTQATVQALIQFTQHLGSNPNLLPFEDVDQGEPLIVFGVPTGPTPPSAPSLPAVLPWMDTEEGDSALLPLGSVAVGPGGQNTQVQFNDNGVFNGDALLTWTKGTGPLTEGGAVGIGITSTDGVVVQNTSPATAVVTVQFAPRMRMHGAYWDTGGLATVPVDGRVEFRPVSGSGTGQAPAFFWGAATNNAAFQDFVKMLAGVFSVSGEVVCQNVSCRTSNGSLGTGFGHSGGFISAQGGYLIEGNLVITSQGVAQLKFENFNQTEGIGIDYATDAVLKLRNRTLVAGTGSLDIGATINAYNNVSTAGWGVPAIYAAGRSTAQTAAVASVAAYTVGSADGSFEVSANVLVTTATTHNFTVTCAYTDESNTARTLTMAFTLVAGTLTTAIVNGNGAVPYMGLPVHLRCKASTTITIATTGTFTTVTYNVEGIIKQQA